MLPAGVEKEYAAGSEEEKACVGMQYRL